MSRWTLHAFHVFRGAAIGVALALTTVLPVAAVQNVLLVAPYASGTEVWITDVQSKIAGTGLISGGVDWWDLTTMGSLSPSMLRQYAAILVWTDGNSFDANALGDSLADYVDCGGGVVEMTFSFNIPLGGRWSTDHYDPIQILDQGGGNGLTLGAIFNPAHPILAGVSSFNGGTSSYLNTGSADSSCTLIANWSNGSPFLVEKPGLNGRLVALNFFPPSNAVRADLWVATTDGAKLMANALVYVMDTTAPTATVTTSAATAAQPDSIVARASCLASAALHYRNAGGSATYTTVAMADSAPGAGVWKAVIPGTDVGQSGVQYYVELSDGRNTGFIPAGAPATCSSIRVSRSTSLALPAMSYVMAGVSFAPTSAAPEALFGSLGAYKKKWRYATYDGSAYHEPGGGNGAPAGAVPGQGFWIIAKDAASVPVSGKSTDLATDFQITLKPGFNQISNPYSFAVAATALVLPAAVERNLFSYTGSGYAAGNATLSPGVGYWIKNNGPGNQTITIPMSTAPSPASPVMRPGALADGESGWSVLATARAGAFVDTDTRFGERAGATDAKDGFDFSHAPAPPEGYVSVSLLGQDGTPLLSDYRAQAGDGARWQLRFSSDQAGQPFHVRFDVEHALPSGWVMQALGPGGLRAVDLLADGELSGTVGTGVFTRDWTVVAGTPGYAQTVRTELGRDAAAFAFSAPVPNPARATSFDLALPQAAHVDVRVFDVSGRAVRTLVNATLERGYHLIAWDGADASSRHVADGVYFVRLQAAGHDETRKVVLLR